MTDDEIVELVMDCEDIMQDLAQRYFDLSNEP